MSQEQKIADRLHALLSHRFGDDWRRDISLTHRADTLYWLVHLAERGLEAIGTEWRAHGALDASQAASLGSWTLDLQDLLKKIEFAITPLSTKKKGQRGV